MQFNVQLHCLFTLRFLCCQSSGGFLFCFWIIVKLLGVKHAKVANPRKDTGMREVFRYDVGSCSFAFNIFFLWLHELYFYCGEISSLKEMVFIKLR